MEAGKRPLVIFLLLPLIVFAQGQNAQPGTNDTNKNVTDTNVTDTNVTTTINVTTTSVNTTNVPTTNVTSTNVNTTNVNTTNFTTTNVTGTSSTETNVTGTRSPDTNVTTTADRIIDCPMEPQGPGCNRTLKFDESDECFTDLDCSRGGDCCFKGCNRKCLQTQPCGSVVCKKGFVCLEEMLPCAEPPCHKQANCIPLEESRCLGQTRCPACPSGYRPIRDAYGCDVTPCTCEVNTDKVCGTTCHMACPYGFVMKDGCFTCQCKSAPESPCTDRECDGDTECRLVHTPCQKGSCLCKPRDICVPKSMAAYDDRCVDKDPSTLGRPVLGSDLVTPLNCSGGNPCPDNTVCVGAEDGLFSCCWQHTQARLYEGSPKPGKCPNPLAVRSFSLKTPCQLDAHCPADEKCCYQDASLNKEYHVGRCVTPLANLIKEHALCTNSTSSTYGLEILKLLNICP